MYKDKIENESSNLILMLMPSFLRTSKHVAWLSALLKPLDKLKDDFRDFCSANIHGMDYKLKHNGQVCYLEKALNDSFDANKTARRIRIVDGRKFVRQYLYIRSMYQDSINPKPRQYLNGTHNKKMYLRKASDYADTGVDFIVQAPTSILFKDGKPNEIFSYKMPALINAYKLASKRYSIEAYG